MEASHEPLRIAVGIATAGRRQVLSRSIELVLGQTFRPERILVSPVRAADVDLSKLFAGNVPSQVLIGAVGLPAQRNLILKGAKDADVIVFFDDDFFPCADYLDQVERLFRTQPEIIALTGRPIIDGVNGPGLGVDDALNHIAELNGTHPANDGQFETYGTYGCNMAFRLEPIRAYNLSFDENLPLYGWQEDIDFSRRLAGFGKIVDSRRLRGIHLGTKEGRGSGLRFGYSQIANPFYLARKGSICWRYALSLMWRNIAANAIRSFWSEKWIDRRGRLRGNLRALLDLLMGRIAPQRIINLR
jgi:hypothetical protein